LPLYYNMQNADQTRVLKEILKINL
jgi:hypothetical protein